MTRLFWACLLALPAIFWSAQTAPAQTQTQTQNAFTPPTYSTVEGQPIDPRPPENSRDKPLWPEQTRAPYHKTAPFNVTVLADNLSAPWGMAFLPDGNILVTERLPGHFRIIGKNGGVSAPLEGVPKLSDTPQTGYFDVVLDPRFASNRRIYFSFFSYQERTVGATSIARAVLDGNTIKDVKVIFRATPFLPNDQNISQGTKSGGRLAFGRDGYLYVVVGDRDAAGARPWGVAQIPDTHLGKVLRLTVDGKPAPGNPFTGQPGALPEIWAMGLRSPEGLAFDPATGKLYETEHGPRGGDEFNEIKRGGNYGWPLITHGIDYSGKPVGDGAVAKEGTEQPVYYWSPSTAPSSLAFYNAALFPEWKDSVFVGMLRGRYLARFKLVDGKVTEEEALLADMKERFRDVRVGPDGAVYALTDSGGLSISDDTPLTSKLLKLTPK